MTTGRYVALDFETSGYAAHSACAVGLCRIEDGVVTDSFYSLIRPPSSRVLFTHVHGLTWPMLKDAPTFTEVWPQLVAFMEGSHALLAHNAGFDRSVACILSGSGACAAAAAVFVYAQGSASQPAAGIAGAGQRLRLLRYPAGSSSCGVRCPGLRGDLFASARPGRHRWSDEIVTAVRQRRQEASPRMTSFFYG